MTTTFTSPVNIGETVYDADSNAWVVYSVQFYPKNIALKCSSQDNAYKKTFLVGKKTVGKTIFVGEDAFEQSLKIKATT